MRNQKGFGTIELVILIAILVGLALLFKNFVVTYTQGLMDEIQSVELDIEHFGESE
jgi:Tfp pilus assembly protein PilE